MSVIYYCDAPGCVEKSAGQVTDEGWDSPENWGGARAGDKMYDICSPDCAHKVSAMLTPPEEKGEEQTITADDVGTLEA